MNSKSRIDAIRLKSERAKEHIRNLDARIAEFRDRHPYEIAAKPHPVAQIEHTTLYVKSLSSPPTDLGLIIGDVVHNLRSAFDHLAWHLVERGGGTPNKDTYFPICWNPKGAEKFASACGKGEIKKIPKGAEKLLLDVQPYMSGDDTLRVIHELDIHDKHRLLITVATGYKEWSVTVGGGVVIPFEQWNVVPLEAGDHITNLPTSTYEREPHENYKLRIEVAFGQTEIVERKAVLPTLRNLRNSQTARSPFSSRSCSDCFACPVITGRYNSRRYETRHSVDCFIWLDGFWTA